MSPLAHEITTQLHLSIVQLLGLLALTIPLMLLLTSPLLLLRLAQLLLCDI